jgi:hypothetical protein
VFNEKAKTTLTCNQKRKECTAFILNISPIHFDSYQIIIGVENGATLLYHGLVGEQVYFTVIMIVLYLYSISSLILFTLP